MKNKYKQSGQAIMELLVLLLSFIICFLGLLLIMGFSIANIEILQDAKFNAEKDAQYADYGGDGIYTGEENGDVRDWQYTKYDMIEYPIPFLPQDKPLKPSDMPQDKPSDIQGNLYLFKCEFDNPVYSQNGDRYAFNTFDVITPSIANNIPYDVPSQSYLAANLHKGKSNKFYDENNALLTDHRYFKRQQIYEAFERIIGTKLKDIDLENNHSNTVYFPAMKVLENFSVPEPQPGGGNHVVEL